jgi:hypothetical protein
MKTIKLSQGMVALVDDEDYEKLIIHKWFVSKNNSGKIYYAHRRAKKADKRNTQQIAMHREIIGDKEGFIIDHINRNGLDNRKENLRHVTHSQNRMNKDLIANKTSRFAGVAWSTSKNKWRSYITCALNKKFIHLGYFDNELVAAIYYSLYLNKYFNHQIGLYR